MNKYIYILDGCAEFHCIQYFRAQEIRSLCQVTAERRFQCDFVHFVFQGDRSLRPASQDVHSKCELLSFNNSYLKLGPFQLENLNKNGHYIALVHSFLSMSEVEDVKNQSKGNMKATPYRSEIGSSTTDFSYKRTSKIKYFRYVFDKLKTNFSFSF